MPEQITGPRTRVNFTLSRKAIQLLEASSKALGTSKSSIAEQAIRRFWSDHVADVAQALKVRPRRR